MSLSPSDPYENGNVEHLHEFAPPPTVTEHCEDGHITWLLDRLDVPADIWIAPPSVVVLMMSGADKHDLRAEQDGTVSGVWDRADRKKLVFPVMCPVTACTLLL